MTVSWEKTKSHEPRAKSNMASRLIMSVGRMELEDSLAQVLDIDVGINLGGGDVFVSEQLLDDTQVGTVLEKMRSERVSERVGRDGLVDSCRSGEAFDDGEDHRTCELPAVVIEKSDVLELGFDIEVRTVFHPVPEPFLRLG